MHKRRIYVASSWRNTIQPTIVELLRAHGHEVYDFRNPAPGNTGFAWRDCGGAAAQSGPGSGAKTIDTYMEAIVSQRAKDGFKCDKDALDWCDTCILVLPCGRSAHLEAGYTAGQGKDTYFLLHPDKFEPELMYLLGTAATPDIRDILGWMDEREPGDVVRWHQLNGGHGAGLAGHALRALREMVELCFASGGNYYSMKEALDAEAKKVIERTLKQEPIRLNPGKCDLHDYLLADESCTCVYDTTAACSSAEIAEEWADIAILLQVFARYANVDQHKAIRDKVDILWARQWRADMNGVLWQP